MFSVVQCSRDWSADRRYSSQAEDLRSARRGVVSTTASTAIRITASAAAPMMIKILPLPFRPLPFGCCGARRAGAP